MPKSTTKMWRVALTAMFAMMLLAEGLTTVSAQKSKSELDAATKACNAKYEQCLNSCTVKAGCYAPCGFALLKCADASYTPEQKAAIKANAEKNARQAQKEAADAATFFCKANGAEMLIYGTNKTYRTLTCDVSCQYYGGNKKLGSVKCNDIVVGPHLTKAVVARSSSGSEPPPYELTTIGYGCR